MRLENATAAKVTASLRVKSTVAGLPPKPQTRENRLTVETNRGSRCLASSTVISAEQWGGPWPGRPEYSRRSRGKEALIVKVSSVECRVSRGEDKASLPRLLRGILRSHQSPDPREHLRLETHREF